MTLTRRHGDVVVATCALTVERGHDEAGDTLALRSDDGGDETHGVSSDDAVDVAHGARVEAGAVLYRRDRTCTTWCAELAPDAVAEVRFRDLLEWITCDVTLDPVTGLMQRRVRASPSRDRWTRMRPRIELCCGGVVVRRVPLEAGAFLTVHDGDLVRRGDRLAWLPRTPSRGDGTVARGERLRALLEGRRPARPAALATVSGRVSVVGPRHVAIAHAGGTSAVARPRWGPAVWVREGDFVYAGEALTDGALDPRALAAALGREGYAAWLCDEVEALLREGGGVVEASAVERVVAAVAAGAKGIG